MKRGLARTEAAIVVAGLGFAVAIAGPLRLAARLPGPAGRAALAELLRRGDEAETRRALGLLSDPAADAELRGAIAQAFGERRAAVALPALVAALNGDSPFVASSCSRALAAFDPSGRSFDSEGPPTLRAAIVLEWNDWWRAREGGLRAASGLARGGAAPAGFADSASEPSR
jgi:hypothetical protein